MPEAVRIKQTSSQTPSEDSGETEAIPLTRFAAAFGAAAGAHSPTPRSLADIASPTPLPPATVKKPPEYNSAKLSNVRSHFVIVDQSGVKAYVWSYRATISNPTPRRIQLRGRHWDIKQDSLAEQIDIRDGSFAPSLGGECPILEPGGAPHVYEAAVASFLPERFDMSGAFKAGDLETGEPLFISIPEFTFELPDSSGPATIQVAIAGRKLSDDGASVVRAAVRKYNETLTSQLKALFRTDDLALSPSDHELVVAYLIAEGQSDRRKNRSCDFAPIMPDGSACLLSETTDHYFLPRRTWHGDPVGLEKRFKDLLIAAYVRLGAARVEELAEASKLRSEYANENNSKVVDFTAFRAYNYPVVPQIPTDGAALEEELRRILAKAREELGEERVTQIIAASAPHGDSAHLNMGMASRDPNEVHDEALALLRLHRKMTTTEETRLMEAQRQRDLRRNMTDEAKELAATRKRENRHNAREKSGKPVRPYRRRGTKMPSSEA